MDSVIVSLSRQFLTKVLHDTKFMIVHEIIHLWLQMNNL